MGHLHLPDDEVAPVPVFLQGELDPPFLRSLAPLLMTSCIRSANAAIPVVFNGSYPVDHNPAHVRSTRLQSMDFILQPQFRWSHKD